MEVSRDELKILFNRAIELNSADRDVFLDRKCLGKTELRAELDSLITSYDGAPEYFDRLSSEVLPEPIRELGTISPNEKEEDDALIGQTIAQYEILERLGAGGMGIVYKARHKKLDRFVALKFLPNHLNTNSEAKARFIHEAKAAYALDHPNICTIHDIGETDGQQLFIAMAFYEGETIKERLQRGLVSPDEAIDYIGQIAEGLVRAHDRGIVHRDIKPANLFITEPGVVKILDFGIATGSSSISTGSGRTLGTVAYMSPEQARGEEIKHTTDIWSLGVVLYEMLTGERPFHAEYEQAVIYNILNIDPKPISNLDEALSTEIENLIHRCLDKNPENRYQSAADLFAETYRIKKGLRSQPGSPLPDVATGTADPPAFASGSGARLISSTDPDGASNGRGPSSMPSSARIFISYKRSVDADRAIAKTLVTELQKQHQVFIDEKMVVGARWVERIESEIARSDYFIVLLSGESVRSEMVLAEIEIATRIASEHPGKAKILPVRVNYSKPFTYPLSAYLNHLNWTQWKDQSDTESLISSLIKAISRGKQLERTAESEPSLGYKDESGLIPEPMVAAQPQELESPEGTMDPQSAFYIERDEDSIALNAVTRAGMTLTIKGPRQLGKSSLLLRTMAKARELGKKVVYIDFQLFDSQALENAETFFKQFSAWIADELELEDRIDEFWKRPLGNSQRCTRYMGRHILKNETNSIVLAMDEVERVFDTDFRSDFFSMLRSWHNDRAIDPKWKRLDLVLVTSTEPYQLIENLNQSPFNVGEIVSLGDFTSQQLITLNHLHGSPLNSIQVEELHALIGGHPYLSRKSLHLLACKRITFDELVRTAATENSPFSDHLRHHLFRLHGQQSLVSGMRSVLQGQSLDDEHIFWRLRGAGLIKRQNGGVVPRCQLYAEFFREHLDA